MSGAETVVVTQADREAAARAGLDMARLNERDAEALRQGGAWDEWALVQAFARHRLATQADALAVMREAEGALAELAAEKPGARPRALRTLANLRAAIARAGGAA
jgi:hypothetical protein